MNVTKACNTLILQAFAMAGVVGIEPTTNGFGERTYIFNLI
ncbi:hypothetical protein [Clostridium kluyveri]|nr:hypothetical protein [Clostridium kluyveri]